MVMRVLFTCNLGQGHWRPLAPLAQAMKAAGHETAFATTPLYCQRIAEHGFLGFPAGTDDDWRDPFEVSAKRRVPELLALCHDWQPDMIVREQTEYAGCLVAESLGLPHATLQISYYRGLAGNQPLVEPLNQLRAVLGLPPDPELITLYRYLLLLPFPPSYRDPAAALPPTAHFIQAVNFDALHPKDELPAWIKQLPQRPTIYASLGTAFANVDIFRAILRGLRDESVNLVVTIDDFDPGQFGPQPPNVHIEHYLPQDSIFPFCSLVITHGGAGTVRTALAYGLPMVIIPIAADQPNNAQRCAELGVARVIPSDRHTPEAIREAARAILGDQTYRQRAAALQQEMETLPGLVQVVALLERLARERQPLT